MTEFDLTNEKLCVLAALLGNYLLPAEELRDVHEKANVGPMKRIVMDKRVRYVSEMPFLS